MADHIQRLIDEGLNRMGWVSDAAHRLRVLDKINECEREIGQPGSFMYLQKKYPIILSNSITSVALPTSPAIDYGKSMALRIIGEPGYLVWLPPDRLYTASTSTYYALRNDRPCAWTVERDASQVITIFFDQTNTTGGNLTLELTAQMAVANLVDQNTSLSLLPDGYEWTLLLGRAQAKLLTELDRPGAKEKSDENDDLLKLFYSGQRVPKKWSATEREIEQRKAEEDNLDPEND